MKRHPANFIAGALLCVVIAVTIFGSGVSTISFVTAFAGILPLAIILVNSTEELVELVGGRVGGLINATLGNAVELIIAFFALKDGHIAVVKYSLTGSIVSNLGLWS